MALRSNHQRWEHKHAYRLRGDYFCKRLVLKMGSLNPERNYISGILAVQSFTRSNIQKIWSWAVEREFKKMEGTLLSLMACGLLLRLSIIRSRNWF